MDTYTLKKAVEINSKIETLEKILFHQFPHERDEVKMERDLNLNQVELKFDATVASLVNANKFMGVRHSIKFSGPNHNQWYSLKIVGDKEKSHEISFNMEEAVELRDAVNEFNNNLENIITNKINTLRKELDSL